LKFLKETLGLRVLGTSYKKLMCGDEGYGALIDVATIEEQVLEAIK
jgi:hypothetical protein